MLKKFIKTIPTFGNIEEQIRLQNMLVHKSIKGYPKFELTETKEIIPSKEDLLLTERLLKAYKSAQLDGKKIKPERQDIWTFLENGPQSDFFELLEKGDVREIAYYLCNMSKFGMTHGITQGKILYEKISSDSAYRKWLGIFMSDKIIRLAEALGVIPLENPEQGEYGLSIHSDINEIIDKIETYLRISIMPPDFEGGLFRLSTKKGRIHHRDILAVYTAWRCSRLLETVKEPSICEIGAGIGKAAYYSRLLGIKQYTIIDLPHINFLHGYYLIKCFPSVDIYLYGEKQKNKADFISIQPDWYFKTVKGKDFDLTLNEDSFPEIDRAVVLDYLKEIKYHTKNYFLSINQESQNTMMIGELKQHMISKLVSEIEGFEQIYRFPYWMREGYLEELYKINS